MNDPWKTYHAIAARVGSLAPSKLNASPLAVQKILEEDVPTMLKIMKAVIEYRDFFAEARTTENELAAADEFHLKLNDLEL